MAFKLKTASNEEPVSLSEARYQAGITDENDTSRDDIISTRITSARRWAEQYTRIAFVTQTWVYYSNRFEECILLKSELQSIVSVKYTDTDGAQQTLDPSNYYADVIESRIQEAYGKVWPTVRDFPNSVEIEFVCGFGAANQVPEEIKDAIKFIVGHWENYQSGIEGLRISTIPYAVEQLLRPHKDFRGLF